MKRLLYLLAALPLMLASCHTDEADPADNYICWWDVASYTATYTERNLSTGQETTRTSSEPDFGILFTTKWGANTFAIPYLAQEEGGQLLVHIADDGSLWADEETYTDDYNGRTSTVTAQLSADQPTILPVRLHITVTTRGVQPALTGSYGYRFERVEKYDLQRTVKMKGFD